MTPSSRKIKSVKQADYKEGSTSEGEPDVEIVSVEQRDIGGRVKGKGKGKAEPSARAVKRKDKSSPPLIVKQLKLSIPDIRHSSMLSGEPSSSGYDSGNVDTAGGVIGGSYTCEICGEDDLPDYCNIIVPQNSYLRMECRHGYCTECLVKTIDKGGDYAPTCPNISDGKHPIGFRDLAILKGFKVADTLSIRSVHAALKGKTIHCPKAGCDWFCERVEEAIPKYVFCRNEGCGTVFCPSCSNDYQEGHTCTSQKTGIDEKTLQSVTQGKLTLCPNKVCSTLIHREDDGGCNEITCQKCETTFCYYCRSEWVKSGEEGFESFDDNHPTPYQCRKVRQCPDCRSLARRVDWDNKVTSCTNAECTGFFCYDCGMKASEDKPLGRDHCTKQYNYVSIHNKYDFRKPAV